MVLVVAAAPDTLVRDTLVHRARDRTAPLLVRRRPVREALSARNFHSGFTIWMPTTSHKTTLWTNMWNQTGKRRKLCGEPVE
ncbi:hypothetical protein GCM10027029_18270 [Conyzicola lurida]